MIGDRDYTATIKAPFNGSRLETSRQIIMDMKKKGFGCYVIDLDVEGDVAKARVRYWAESKWLEA